MSKTNKKQTNSQNKTSLAKKIIDSLDAYFLEKLPSRLHVSGRLLTVEKAYTRDTKEKNKRYGRKVPCPLCEDISSRHIKFSTETMIVMANDYPYHMYDGAAVEDHMMLVPRRHLHSLSQLDKQEQAEYWKLYIKLADMGYNTVTRPRSNKRRSVPGHVHTHLISQRSH